MGLKVKLVGTVGNRDGLGARVTVRAGDRSYVQVNDRKSGYLGQSSLPLYFGLADATRVDEVHVKWLSGAKQKLGPVEANQAIEISESK